MNIKALGAQVRTLDTTVDVGLEGRLAVAAREGDALAKDALERVKKDTGLIATLNRQSSGQGAELRALRGQLRDLENGDTLRALVDKVGRLEDMHSKLVDDLGHWRGEAANLERLRDAYGREAERYLNLLQRIELAGENGGATAGQLVEIAKERLK